MEGFLKRGTAVYERERERERERDNGIKQEDMQASKLT